MNSPKIVIKDEMGNRYKYALVYLYYGWEYEEMSNDLRELHNYAKEMLIDNSGKPLIIVNDNDDIVREYAERLFSSRIGAHNKLDIFTSQ